MDDIPGVTVVETLKEGRTIYLAGQKERVEDYRLSPMRHASREVRALFADDGAAATGCACCDGTLTGSWREAALKSMSEFAESPLLS